MAQIIVKGLIGEEDLQKYDGTATTFTRANSTGGTSTLTPVGAGSSGLKFAKVFASSVVTLSSNPAASGVLRLATGDAVAWRNNGNGADILLGKDTSVRLTFNGNTVQAAIYNSTGSIQNISHISEDPVTPRGRPGACT